VLLIGRAMRRKCIATGIYPGFNKIAEFWETRVFDRIRICDPTKHAIGNALRYWKGRGSPSMIGEARAHTKKSMVVFRTGAVVHDVALSDCRRTTGRGSQ